jgi:hypothetical protein
MEEEISSFREDLSEIEFFCKKWKNERVLILFFLFRILPPFPQLLSTKIYHFYKIGLGFSEDKCREQERAKLRNLNYDFFFFIFGSFSLNILIGMMRWITLRRF